MKPAAATEASALAGRFHALSDRTRVRIVELLRGGEHCVCELTEALELTQPLLSFHLKVLKAAGLVRDRRQGRWAYYSLDPSSVAELRGFLGGLTASTCRRVTARCRDGQP
jgi:ArsR family transcriptional regulator, arsenate/arsenite/antimonite-responsive transcriptional repressor